MTKKVITVTAKIRRIEEAAYLMAMNKIGGLPVHGRWRTGRV